MLGTSSRWTVTVSAAKKKSSGCFTASEVTIDRDDKTC